MTERAPKWVIVVSDPVWEAARRAWAKESDQYTDCSLSAIREALAPIRELHKPVPIRPLVDDCGDDTAEHERLHHHLAMNNDEMVCDALRPDGWTCAECATVAADNEYGELPDWPCPTARLVYTTTELENPQ